MRKILGLLVLFFLLLSLPACTVFGLGVENALFFTVIGRRDQIEFRQYGEVDYRFLTSDIQKMPSYTWIKTLDSEAALDLGKFGTMFIDKNSLVQVRICDKGVYIIQAKGNGYHAVNTVLTGNYYNVLTSQGLNVVKGTGFGTENNSNSNWVDVGEVVVIEDIIERHEDMSEEDVPEGPLWVYGNQTYIVIRGNRAPRLPQDAFGTNVEEGQESIYDPNTGRSNTRIFDPNLQGDNWRQRARDLYRQWRDLEAQHSQLGDQEFQNRLLGLMNAYLVPLTDEQANTTVTDCASFRVFLPSALFAVGQLRGSEEMIAAADEEFKDFGGLAGMDAFLNSVCADNTIDSRERQFIDSFVAYYGA